jgi:two-component sensor histidine kinase
LKPLSQLLCMIVFLFSCKEHIPKENTNDNVYYDKAFLYREKGLADSAFFYFNNAKDLFLQQKDSVGIGKCLVNMGLIAINKGDYFGAQEMSVQAIPCFDQKKEEQFVYISSNFNNLGVASHCLLDYSSAIKFYNSAIAFSKDTLAIRVNQNNKAKIYQELKDYKTSLNIYRSILKEVAADKKPYARALTSIAYTKWLQDPGYNPVPVYQKALRLRKEENDLWGENSSYAHLAEYYSNKAPDSAFQYASMRYLVAKQIQSPDDQRGALKALVTMSPVKETKIYFDLYQHLDDSLQTARWNAKNQFALVRYETEKHKAEALRARAETVEKKNSLLIQNFVLAALMLSLISGSVWYRKRRKILQQEKELGIRNTELKYVKKIHDRVANRVYHLLSEVENSAELNKDLLLDKLEILYNTSRDISYEHTDATDEGNYVEKLSEMLQSYSSPATEVLIVGNDAEIWNDIAEHSKTEFYLVMQELMTNMRKHSKARTVVLKFQRDASCITLLYADNGIGMQEATAKNGLQNTENRMESIGGTITFESILEKGLEITVSFPVA